MSFIISKGILWNLANLYEDSDLVQKSSVYAAMISLNFYQMHWIQLHIIFQVFLEIGLLEFIYGYILVKIELRAVCCVLCAAALRAVCYVLRAVCCALYAACAARCVLRAVCCVLRAVCCALRAACCMLWSVCCLCCAMCAARCVLGAARCALCAVCRVLCAARAAVCCVLYTARRV